MNASIIHVKRVMFFCALILAQPVFATDHIIEAKARKFKPEILYAKVGDKVKFVKMTSHNIVAAKELIPEGVEPWNSPMGKDFSTKLEKPGIYPFVCLPHIGFGMMGVIVVGNISAEEIATHKQKAMDTQKGPWRRLIGYINKIKPVE